MPLFYYEIGVFFFKNVLKIYKSVVFYPVFKRC